MRYLLSIFLGVQLCMLSAQSPLISHDSEAQKQWVDSVYNTLSLKQKVGQLFMVQAFSEQKNLQKEKLLNLIKKQHIGGIIYSKGGPVRQAHLDNELQANAKIPLLVGMDAEWGLSMRLDSTYAFPWNMTLGAVSDLELIRKTGQQIGEHCKRLGVHFNFAPVVDINTNPKNPIIGNRSFGEDKTNVTQKALAFMQGMQSVGVLANAKHFPGHGDTDKDSHKTLPTVNFNKRRIRNVELFPYKELIPNGLSSVMVAHLNVPSLDSRTNYPSSLSHPIVTELLKTELNFEGLIFTDALDMKGASNFSTPGEIDVQAFLAGNDVLLMSNDVAQGVEKITYAVIRGQISENRLAHSVKKILSAKYKVGLHAYQPIQTEHLIQDLNRIKDDILYEQLMQNAHTLVKNSKSNVPLRDLELRRIAYVALGDDKGDTFFNTLQNYTEVVHVESENLDDLIQNLKQFNTVVIGFHKSDESPWKPYQFSNKELVWLQEIARNNEVVLTVFAKPYALEDLKSFTNIESILMAYQNSEISQQVAAQIIFGGLSAKGKLPVSVSKFNVGHGIDSPTLDRLSYGKPEHVGMSTLKLSKLDSFANHAIAAKMTPGIQLLVARKGKVIYNKNFGHHTYQKVQKVSSKNVYDLASLTKILVTVPLLMELVESGIITLEDRLGDLLPKYKGTDKEGITLKKMLSHFARLKPWIPFYKSALDSVSQKPIPEFFKSKKSKNYPIQISDDKFLRKDLTDTIHQQILNSELLEEKEYHYSDLPYYILKEFIERYYDQPLNELIDQHFYKSIGANFSTYLPLEKFSKNQIIPTEDDSYFRFETVHGYVHDMGAAMQNGVGGHAGLFSNANDVAKLMQMYLQHGFYGGKQYLNPSTIDAFNTCYFCEEDNRRGVGFDKPQLEDEGPTCGCISMTSFGHSGFTGTYAWADPEEEIIYVFLSNRTYPDSKNNRLLEENIRTEIQRFIYKAIID
ncbi:MAG: glycoside hydrolase family 3 N-terminal domain-containing protein [Flavobacteriaceae bacterium]|nr:glycoside hydrolase family 3 N-terminal domain-containing protein [Flavobacteriaceae bacterium]